MRATIMFTKIHTFFIAWSKKHSRKNVGAFLETELSGLSPHAVVLNIGSGGTVEKHIHSCAPRTATLYSIDIDPKRTPKCVGDACALPFGPGRFDVVCLMAVLEHIRSPQAALDEIRRVLKPGGQLIFSVPFIHPIHDRPHDYFRFTRYGLELLLQRYNNVTISARNSFSETVSVLIMRLIMEKGYLPKLSAMLYMLSGILLTIPLFNLLIKTDALTTGYLGSAQKPGPTAG